MTMTTTTQLSPSQFTLLAHAAQHTGGIIEWFPDNLKGGARSKVLEALEKRGLVECVKIPYASSVWQITEAGYELIGAPLPKPEQQPEHFGTSPEKINEALSDHLVSVAQVVCQQTHPSEFTEPPAKRTRANSKQAQVIALLQRPEGTTIPQICEVTGWQSHTVRGTFAGAFKKKLGLDITSSKEAGGERIYRLA